MASVNFIFTIHFHQPHGQLKWINEKIYVNSYRLLLEIFKKYADLHFTVHISGPLLLYMIDNHPEWIDEIAKLGDYGTIEFLAGSLGEAILPLLPLSDRVDQVREYIRLFEKYFGLKPRGLWLPERVWEPSLPIPLAENGIEYVLVDDSTLLRAGHPQEDAYYAWNTEEGGERVKVFFIDAGLRYVLPWSSSEEVFNYMMSKATDTGDRVLVWGSDAEKFGEWADPGWARWWLNDFLSKLRLRRNEIKLLHPTEYLREHGVRGLIYLPTGSYDKMLEWSNGFFRNFQLKYRESNNMHKKMLYVRGKLVKAPKIPREAWTLYYLAQCNDAYWHGLFGGIYLSHLRQAIYENLIKAEKIAEEEIGYYEKHEPVIKRVDFDYDGRIEVLYESRRLNAYFKPSDGGTMFELDIKRDGYEHNLQDTMTRYPEPYLHGSGFNPDWYRRVSLRVHLWEPSTTLHDWINNTPFKDNSDLALKKYSVSITPSDELIMRSLGGYYLAGSLVSRILVEKRIKVRDNELSTTYIVENKGDKPVTAKIGYEYHLAPKIDRTGKGEPIGYIVNGEFYTRDNEWGGITRQVVFKAPDYPDIKLETRKDEIYWIAPLNMLARTEKGFKPIPQGIAVMIIREKTLRPGDRETLIAKLELP